jgi:hypothetical protein
MGTTYKSSINLFRILEILKAENKDKVNSFTVQTLCSILEDSVDLGLEGKKMTGDLELPSGYFSRKQMWMHFKSCEKCGFNIRKMKAHKKRLDIKLWRESVSGKIMVTITLLHGLWSRSESSD